jgi:UMF1 family MFS transporter
LLGAIADCMSRRKAMLFSFAFLGVLMTAGLYLIGEGDWFLAAFLYVLAIIGFSGSNVFYDSLLPFVSRKDKIDQASALGFSMGYLGGGILLSINVLMALHPEKFGLADGAAAIRISFLMVAAWWLIFSLPLMLLVEEPDVVAYWLYIDGVDTIVRMAVDYGLSLGFDQNSLITALLITQFTGFPAALAFGWFGGRYGPKTGIFIGLAVYILVTVWASVMDSVSEFYYLAFLIGLAQGGIQALSRSLYARMIPADRSAEFFGFYNMLGKFAAILGPVMIGWVGVISGNPRTGILSLLVLFVVGGLVLAKVEVLE